MKKRTDPSSLAFGGELGLPTGCQLGKITQRGTRPPKFCGQESVVVIDGVRVCAKHLARLDAIVRDAQRIRIPGRRPRLNRQREAA